MGTLGSSAQAAISREYQVKAAFLFNLAQFVTWPPRALGKPDQPFIIGVLGKDPFGRFLDETVKGEKVGTHPMVVRRYGNAKDARNCQIVFISQSEKGRQASLLEDLKGRSVLTVGDFEGFAKGGGVVRFLTDKGKVRFRINLGAAKSAGLDISSRILRVAEIVETGKD
jgi:hypothetical protein